MKSRYSRRELSGRLHVPNTHYELPFTGDCFDIHSALASQFGMKKRRRLKSGAIPTIFHRPSTAQGAAETGESHAIGQFQWLHDDEGSQVYKRRGAVEKRQV